MSWSPIPDPTLGDAASVDAVETLIVPRAVDLGEMTVRRALPTIERQMVGPFIFWDQMGPAEFLTNEGLDVRPHPHINLATLTYLLDGVIHHRDSLGTSMAIRPGDVNWMSAGKGIVHSERSPSEVRGETQRLFGLQTWVALPEAKEESNPDFIHHGVAELPFGEDGEIEMRVVAGQTHGLKSPLRTASETLYADVVMHPGGRFQVEATHVERALYVIEGQIQIGDDMFEAGQLMVLRPGEAIMVASAPGARLMLFGGDPMEGPRYIWWNFVSSRPERIEQAKEEWRRGRFDTVPGDEEDFIPLPDNATKPRRAVGGADFA